VTLGGGYQENYNNNSIQITAYSSHARTYSADASWNVRSWVSVDASYTRLHLDTLGGIDYFAGAPAQQLTGTSIYISNIHAANLGLRFALSKRADLYAGYNITKDTGDGRTTQSTDPFYNAQTFPLTYQSPLFRLSVRITEKLRYNVGYQYYGYNEQFGLFSTYENFHANTGYTSLLWSF
jgi:predicted porin